MDFFPPYIYKYYWEEKNKDWSNLLKLDIFIGVNFYWVRTFISCLEGEALQARILRRMGECNQERLFVCFLKGKPHLK